jgi:FkbM family methyltransferase
MGKYIQPLLHKFGLKVSRIGPYSIFDFESFLYRHLIVHKTLTFMQIGANDGVMNDPIYQFLMSNKDVVSGYVLEPLPDIFEKLVENYKNIPAVKPFNLAIHTSESEMILNRVRADRAAEIPAFARGIASFDPNHWKKTEIVPNADYMEQVKVSCVSFSVFIKSNAIDNLDLLLLDTEGYDYDILMSIDFENIKPKIIRFEHGIRNQLMSSAKFIQVCDKLNSNGYQVIAESYDATAYIIEPNDLIF